MKNLLLLFPPFFGGKMLDPPVLAVLIPSFLSFSLAASSGYIFNDIIDRKIDRCHAGKKDRPIARGDISVVTAAITAAILCLMATIVSSVASRQFEGFIIIYFFISLLYTLYFKNIIFTDILFISSGFMIRVMAGGEAFHIAVSNWMLWSVCLVSLVLAVGKRLGEMVTLGESAHEHRKTLSRYSRSALEGIIWFSAAGALITYTLYIIERRNSLYYTILLAAYGLIRYIYIVRQGKGDPTDALLKDRQILIVGILWVASIGIIIYK